MCDHQIVVERLLVIVLFRQSCLNVPCKAC